MKVYKSDIDGKAKFVSEVIAPLMVQADTGWYGAEYEEDDCGEFVYLLDKDSYRCKAINVSANSLQAIVLEVFKNI